MQKDSAKQYFRIVALLSLVIACTIHSGMILNYFFGDGDGHHGHRFIVTFGHLGLELLITYVIALLMFTLNYYILDPVEKHDRIKLSRIAIAVILTLLSVWILNTLLFFVVDMADSGSRPYGHREEFDIRNFFVSALVIGCVLIIRLVLQKQNFMLENEALRREALQSQYEALKKQVSPHFLFNSLTALQVLINEAPDKARDYVNSLSKALRYTLQSNEKQLVTLKEELDFMESYLFLIRMRFDSSLTVEIVIPESQLLYQIPPLTIQTLVENAIKHNEISKRHPLIIRILATESGTLVVTNNINKKITEPEGAGIGLMNLSKQFRLLVDKEVSISSENNQFSVEVPLISPTYEGSDS